MDTVYAHILGTRVLGTHFGGPPQQTSCAMTMMSCNRVTFNLQEMVSWTSRVGLFSTRPSGLGGLTSQVEVLGSIRPWYVTCLQAWGSSSITTAVATYCNSEMTKACHLMSSEAGNLSYGVPILIRGGDLHAKHVSSP